MVAVWPGLVRRIWRRAAAGGEAAMAKRASGGGEEAAGSFGGDRCLRLGFPFFGILFFSIFFFACGRLKRSHVKIGFSHAVALATCADRDLYRRFHACGLANRMRKSFSPAWKDLFCSSGLCTSPCHLTLSVIIWLLLVSV